MHIASTKFCSTRVQKWFQAPGQEGPNHPGARFPKSRIPKSRTGKTTRAVRKFYTVNLKRGLQCHGVGLFSQGPPGRGGVLTNSGANLVKPNRWVKPSKKFLDVERSSFVLHRMGNVSQATSTKLEHSQRALTGSSVRCLVIT